MLMMTRDMVDLSNRQPPVEDRSLQPLAKVPSMVTIETPSLAFFGLANSTPSALTCDIVGFN